jgi:hypothetical protein
MLTLAMLAAVGVALARRAELLPRCLTGVRDLHHVLHTLITRAAPGPLSRKIRWDLTPAHPKEGPP